MPGLPIPAGPDALTAEWLTLALREGGSPPRLTVAGFTAEPVGQEYGFTGRLARLQLRYDPADELAPQSLVAKFPDPTAGQRLDAKRLRGRYQRFEREVLFYRQIGADAGIRVPRLHYGDVDVAAGAFVLLLEDLVPGRQGDVFAGCSPEEAGTIVERVAKFHAKWWEHPDLSRFQWLPAWFATATDAREPQHRLSRRLPTAAAPAVRSRPRATRASWDHPVTMVTESCTLPPSTTFSCNAVREQSTARQAIHVCYSPR